MYIFGLNSRRRLIEAGSLSEVHPMVLFSQIIGPAQMLSRQWLSSETDEDIRRHTKILGECAVRALVF